MIYMTDHVGFRCLHSEICTMAIIVWIALLSLVVDATGRTGR